MEWRSNFLQELINLFIKASQCIPNRKNVTTKYVQMSKSLKKYMNIIPKLKTHIMHLILDRTMWIIYCVHTIWHYSFIEH